MQQDEFSTLTALLKDPALTQRQIADICHFSLGTANAAVNELRLAGYIDKSGKVTPAGIKALEPYRVRNAVIMAAGMSTRFAPISYERPKGVLRVRGEVLIERQIRQLQEAGITDIIVVVGYKKEEFFYLEDKMGVRIIINDEYATRNNNSTIKKVEQYLGNTYICSSDDYFSVNPFEQYVYSSYYAAVYQNGVTDEYCLKTKGKDERIVAVEFGGADAWIMLGHAYWDMEYTQKYLEILNAVYNDPATADKLWEDIYAEHIAELPMRMRKYPTDAIWEFDSLDELRGFDPFFMENIDSSILDNICATFDCTRDDVKHFAPLKQGTTNLSMRFEVNGETYVYRHPGTNTGRTVNRASETCSEEIARELDLDRTFICEDPETGWKIAHYIEGCVPFDYHNPEHVEQALAIGRKLHTSGTQTPYHADIYQNTVDLIARVGNVGFADFEELAALAKCLHEHVEADGVEPVLCHIDFCQPNFMVHENGMDLIDWEYSGMSDYASDLGTFICCSDYDIAEAEQVLRVYFQREPSKDELRHCLAYVGLAAFYWLVWALYKESIGESLDEWVYIWYRMTKTFGKHAKKLYE